MNSNYRVIICLLFGSFFLANLVLANTTNRSMEVQFKDVMHPILEVARQLATSHRNGKVEQIPIIAIGGCPGVGKTVFAEKLKNDLQLNDVSVVILKMDDFIKDKNIRNTYKTAWDPNHLNSDSLHQVLSSIIKGNKKLIKPVLDEVTREKSEELLDLTTADLILFEGLYALNTDSPLDFLKYANVGIYIEAQKDDIYAWRWERELRKTNPKTPEHFKKHMQEMMYDFELNVAPTKNAAHYIIYKDSSHNYRGGK